MTKHPELILLRDDLIKELEDLFGPRDSSFHLGSIYSKDKGPPRIFRPEGTNIVDIHLTEDAFRKNDKNRVNWQLAHECVHLLDPSFPPQSFHKWTRILQCMRLLGPSPLTNYLEEGIAVWFQNKKYEKCPLDKDYALAEKLVSRFMDNRCLPRQLKSIRENGTRIGDVKKEQLMREPCMIDAETAEKLTKKFPIK